MKAYVQHIASFWLANLQLVVARFYDFLQKVGETGGNYNIFHMYMLITSSMYFINYLFVPHSPATHVV